MTDKFMCLQGIRKEAPPVKTLTKKDQEGWMPLGGKSINRSVVTDVVVQNVQGFSSDSIRSGASASKNLVSLRYRFAVLCKFVERTK
eukprot:scaffold421253_cov59-Attheya_sp.AAC.1